MVRKMLEESSVQVRFHVQHLFGAFLVFGVSSERFRFCHVMGQPISGSAWAPELQPVLKAPVRSSPAGRLLRLTGRRDWASPN